ncbi:carboxymuconolactone decarboxylase family protein [Acinetobacter seifertii]|uniref:Carboxymuconolactone decarboxylase family protein n=1 Tax=Acinetobacter seifertii TaxID=1530123 RepID=A0A7H2VAX6_9GAMM|nr:carboxymuconolactone decarboxylase family protein [Acinetobacter seifertii]MBZ6534072.1 carboxymuconolactone decarboxylase family protein [Acinetobacter seifertii]QNX73509.1 carboxymuconolactone decarboxylase family protein [Acinetobacter seifertii]
MITQPELRQRGLMLFNQLYGNGAGEALRQDMADICPDFTDITIEWAMGGIMSREGLAPITRELVVIASCVTLGHPVPQLKAHTQAALNAGASRTQIIETILQMLFYAGGAAVRNALVHIQEIVNAPPEDKK